MVGCLMSDFHISYVRNSCRIQFRLVSPAIIVPNCTQIHVSIQSTDRIRKTIGHTIGTRPTRSTKRNSKIHVNITSNNVYPLHLSLPPGSYCWDIFLLFPPFFMFNILFYRFVPYGCFSVWRSNSNQSIRHFLRIYDALSNCAHEEQAKRKWE